MSTGTELKEARGHHPSRGLKIVAGPEKTEAISTASKAACLAVEHFLGRTVLRRSRQREAMVETIRESHRPMATARAFLRRHGVKLVMTARIDADILDIIATRGPLDPVFRERIAKAREQARSGDWTEPDHVALLGVLRAAWSPWSDDDSREARAEAKALREARPCA